MGAPFGNRNNPSGQGGLGWRPWDRWRVGEPGFARCGAHCRRSGLPCKNPPSRGQKRCFLHGAYGGRGKKRPPKSMRVLANREIRQARAEARAEFAATVLHPETMRVWRTRFAGKIRSADVEIFLLRLNQRLNGELDALAWVTIQAQFGV
jgi:hypothetical protein